MALRHPPRHAQEREAARLHDPGANHGHPLIVHPQHSQAHPPMNGGNAPVPTTPGGTSNGSAHAQAGHQMVSPSMAAVTSNGGPPATSTSIVHKLAVANEQTWLLIGRVAEQMGDLEHALSAYENALRHNPMSLSGLTQVAGIARIKENYPKAIEYFQRVLSLQEENGEVWSALGHCYLMQDDLQKAYSAYQQALYLLPNPKEDPKLWYGIGILYDRYGSLDHAEEAFASVLRMDKELDFDKANEILFRLGIIYKQQGKYNDSLACFDRILRNPPSPLAHADIWFQIGHVYEQQKDHARAKDAYERVVADNPHHAKVLQQLGWLYHQDGSSFQNQDLAIQYLTKSLEADPSDAQSWYLLGRAYMAGQKYNKAYEAYQQAVYRDGRNPTFWCSIGVLYFQINQFRDALDAYSRAIRINPYISEVWFDLGSLYESCNNQISDAIDAYARASELDPSNPVITRRLELLKTAQATGGQLPAAPGPQDVHPTAYASAVIPPTGLTGPPLLLTVTPNSRPLFRPDSRGPGETNLPLPPPAQVQAARSSPGPFRGGPPPPVILDETRHVPTHQLAPMEVDRPPHHSRDFPGPGRDLPGRGPVGHQNLLLQHPVPQQQAVEDVRGAGHEQYSARGPLRVPSASSMSPPPHHVARGRSPPAFPSYPSSSRQPVGPGQPSAALPSQRSPRSYSYEAGRPEWERRVPPEEHWDRDGRDRRPRHSGEYGHPQPPQYYSHPSSPSGHRRAHSPAEMMVDQGRGHYDSKPLQAHARATPPPPLDHHARRYDPRFDAREQREPEREVAPEHARAAYVNLPEGPRSVGRGQPPSAVSGSVRESESPRPVAAQEAKGRRKTNKEKDADVQSVSGQEPQKKERKKRTKRAKEDAPEGSGAYDGERGQLQTSAFKSPYNVQRPGTSPEDSSHASVSSNRSGQPSPVIATPRPPSRVLDENYDEGVADALIGLASYRAPDALAQTTGPGSGPSSHSPTISTGSRGSPRTLAASRHRSQSIQSRPSPPSSSHNAMKRPLSPAPDDGSENKRPRGGSRRMSSASNGRRTPAQQASRPSPVPYRTQPASHSPEARHDAPSHAYPPSPPLPVLLPPHPRPTGLSHSASNSMSGPITFPPIATLSPAPPSPTGDDPASPPLPPSRVRITDVVHSSGQRSPVATRPTPSPASSAHSVHMQQDKAD